jgi:hypothetical protein
VDNRDKHGILLRSPGRLLRPISADGGSVPLVRYICASPHEVALPSRVDGRHEE